MDPVDLTIFLLSTAESHPLLALVPTAHVCIPEPRLFGFNPSLEILARITFKLSNKFWIDWTTEDSGWFLNWFGVSADLAMLRAFFSANTPTVWAVFESLCDVVRHLRRSAAARVLFEILTIVRSNNAIVGDGPNFLEVAVDLGSRAEGMIEVATRALAHYDSVQANAPISGRQRLSILLMIAAARCDMPMLRLLVDASARSDEGASLGSSHGPELVALIMRRLCAWSEKEDDALADYMELLIRGGVLSTSLPARCYDLERPEIPIRTPRTFTIDELVMICPPKKRSRLYGVALRLANRDRACVSNAGVFAAAVRGIGNLEAYLQSCRLNNDFEIHETLQESLLFAAVLNDTGTASALLQMKVDPEVSLLSHNQERYHKGDVSWNPMVVAAAAGNLETLKLLTDKADHRVFLRLAPIYEIVKQENTQIRCGEAMGKELLRLENLRRHYMYSRIQNPDITTASDRVFIEPFHGVSTVLSPGDFGGITHPLFCSVEKRRLETLALIREIAIGHGVCGIVDKEIIKAALLNDTEDRAMQCQTPAYHPCDCLLLDGLVDANMEYHESGSDLLQLSIRNQCSMKVVEFLLSKAMSIHSRPDVQTGNTMLHDALLSQSPDRFEIVELLLREGVEYKHFGDGLTVLEASLYGKEFRIRNQQGPFTERLEIFKRLFDAGAPVSCPPRRQLKKWRPLLCLLLDAGADDDLILQVADAGADLNGNVCDLGPQDNRTPLQRAVADGREELAKELIRRGANVHAPAGYFRGYTVLQAACNFDHSLQFIEYLVLEQGANVDETPARISGMSALQWAAFRGSLSLAEFLLDNGADVNGLSGNVGILHGENQMVCRRRALDYAALAGRLDMVEFLLSAGGRSGTGGLNRAINAAKINGHFAVLSVLLEWKKKHGRRIVEEEAEWQRQNPDKARLLSEL